MKKSQKWVIISMIIVPILIMLAVFLIFRENIKDIPLWVIIGLPIVFLVSPFTFLLAQRLVQRKIEGASLQKQRKRLLYAFGVVIALFAIILTPAYYFVTLDFFWTLLLMPVCVLLCMFFGNYRIFFQKKKETTDTVENK